MKPFGAVFKDNDPRSRDLQKNLHGPLVKEKRDNKPRHVTVLGR